MAELDLTPVQFAALATIVSVGDIEASRVAALVAIDRSTIGTVIKRLENKGFIEREYRRDDKRKKRLRATPEGRAMIAEGMRIARRSQERLLTVLEPRDRIELSRLLDLLITAHERVADAE